MLKNKLYTWFNYLKNFLQKNALKIIVLLVVFEFLVGTQTIPYLNRLSSNHNSSIGILGLILLLLFKEQITTSRLGRFTILVLLLGIPLDFFIPSIGNILGFLVYVLIAIVVFSKLYRDKEELRNFVKGTVKQELES